MIESPLTSIWDTLIGIPSSVLIRFKCNTIPNCTEGSSITCVVPVNASIRSVRQTLLQQEVLVFRDFDELLFAPLFRFLLSVVLLNLGELF